MSKTPPTPDKRFRGQKHWHTKLRDKDVLEIRRLGKIGLKLSVIAEKYDVKTRVISCILARKTWKHLPENS